MKSVFLCLVGLLMLHIGFSQSNNNNSSKLATNITILVNDLTVVKAEMDALFSELEVESTNYNVNKTAFNITLYTDSVKYFTVLKAIKLQGYVLSEYTISNSYTSVLKAIEQDILLLEEEKARYQELIDRADSTEQAKYFDYWEKIISIDKSILKKKQKADSYRSQHNEYNLKIKYQEDEIIGSDYSDMWVNMPGLEFSILKTEQPKAGTSSEYMLGYHLKYMVNYQKTYLTMGLYKSQGEQEDSEINEMYQFAIGQDFYSRKLGRGQRKYFNLYTSFNLGVYISSSELAKTSSWYVNPFLGLELFKTKNILIDNKVGYFLPFQNNRNQRGLLYNVSVNFVF